MYIAATEIDENFTRIKSILIPFIKYFEGFSGDRYLCPAGFPTIGYGHLIKPDEQFEEPISLEEATKLLEEDLYNFHKEVTYVLSGLIFTPFQYTALVDFTYNLGLGNFQTSTLFKEIQANNYDKVPTELMRWVYAGKRILKGLQRRRIAEIWLWESTLFDPIKNISDQLDQF